MLYIAFLLIISKEMVFWESTPNGEISCVQRHVVNRSKHCHISHGLVRMCMYIGFYYSLKKSFNALVFIFVGPEF